MARFTNKPAVVPQQDCNNSLPQWISLQPSEKRCRTAPYFSLPLSARLYVPRSPGDSLLARASHLWSCDYEQDLLLRPEEAAGTLLTNSRLDLKGPGHAEPEDLKNFRKLQVLVSQELWFFPGIHLSHKPFSLTARSIP